jgi:hypothetical protein
LAFDLYIILLLVVFATSAGFKVVRSILFLFPLLLFLLLLGAPYFVDVQKFNSDDISLESAVAVLGATDVYIGVQNLGGNISIGPITLVDTQDANDQFSGREKRGKGGLGKVRCKERFALRLVGLLLKLRLELLLLLLK